jgi:hypothetical protein
LAPTDEGGSANPIVIEDNIPEEVRSSFGWGSGEDDDVTVVN